MNADDLAAMKGRHQPCGEHVPTDPPHCGSDFDDWPCDARRLLDERHDYAASDVLAYEAGMSAGAKEQAERITEAVKGLPRVGRPVINNDGYMELPDTVDRSAVLAILTDHAKSSPE